MTKDERIARAIRVRTMLADPDVQSAFESIEDDIIGEWRKGLLKRTREAKHSELKGLTRLRARLAEFANAAPRI